MDDTCRVDVLETTEDLVQEVLDELLLQRAGREESVQVGSEQLGDEVAFISMARYRKGDGAHMSSSGEMKMSLREMIFC